MRIAERRPGLSGPLSSALRWLWISCIPGGVLWSLSPLGVRLSEMKFKTPDVFWKLFPSAPLLLLIGLAGLYLLLPERRGPLTRIGLITALVGLALILAGDLGLFYLHLDNEFIMTAPGYRAFRGGLILLAAGCVLFGVGAARGGALPVWGALPFSIGALAGLIAAARDLGPFGASLWISFGVAWVWLGVVLFWVSARPAAWRR